MRIVFQVGLEPFHLLNKYGGAILFLVIASLALAPLVSLYVALAVTHALVLCQCNGSEVMALASRALQVCSEATLYYSLFFPFLLGLFSTHMSYRMLEGYDQSPPMSAAALQTILEQNSTQLGVEDIDSQESKEQRKIPPSYSSGGNQEARTVSEDCTICLRPYECGDYIAWSANSNCRHVFHLSCIHTWMSQAPNHLCPCCRQQFLVDDTVIDLDMMSDPLDIVQSYSEESIAT